MPDIFLGGFDRLLPVPGFTAVGAVVMASGPAAVRADAVQRDLHFVLGNLHGNS